MMELTPGIPPVERARRAVLNWIAEHGVQPGELLPAQSQLAHALRSSATTVQKALAQLAVENIVERQRGRGTILLRQPPTFGRSAAKSAGAETDTTLRGGIVYFGERLDRKVMPVHALVVQGAERRLRALLDNNVRMVRCRDASDLYRELHSDLLDGAVLLHDYKGSDTVSPEVAQIAYRMEMPVVHIFLSLPDTPALPRVVCVDNWAIGCLAAGAFIEAGHRRLMIAASGEWHLFEQQRVEAFRWMVGSRAEYKLVRGGNDWDACGEAAFRQWYSLAPESRPTGVYCMNDEMARGFVGQALAAGIRLPNDVSVLGVDNAFQHGINESVPLSTIDPMFHRVGESAAELLAKALTEPGSDPMMIRITPKLFIRQTGPIPLQ